MDFNEAMHRMKRLFPSAVEAALAETVNDLLARYAEGHRRYHTLGLLSRRLEWFQTVRYQADEPDALELAALYAAAVSEPAAGIDVIRSAALAQRVGALFERRELGNQAAALILAQPAFLLHGEHTWDEQLFLDITGSDLGAPRADFLVHLEQRGGEGAPSLPAAGWEAAVRRFASAALERPSVFRTRPFRVRLEQQARSNLREVLAVQLEGRS